MRILSGFLVFSALMLSQAMAANTYIIAAFGDSLTAGYGLPPTDAFAAQLEQKLVYDGYPDVKVINDGVNGDTTTDGLARVQAVLLQHPNLVVIEFGINDIAKGMPAADTKKNLDEIMDRLKRAKVKVFLTGLKAPTTMPNDYVEAFNAIFSDLANDYGAVYYPNFLEGADGILGLMQPDGIHLSREGAAVVAGSIGGKIEYDLKKN